MRALKYIVILLCFLIPSATLAGTCEEYPEGSGNWYPGSHSSQSLALADVQQCVTDATGADAFANGDTIHLKAGEVTWTGTLTVNKGINIIGAGMTDTVINKSADNFMSFETTQGFRISAMSWVSADGDYLSYIRDASIGFRFDNIYSERTSDRFGSTRMCVLFTSDEEGLPEGVFDHCEFNNTSVIVSGTSTTCTLSWMADPNRMGQAGGGHNVFFEDNTYYRTSDSGGNCVDSENGGSYAFRFNDVTGTYALVHAARDGDCGRRGSRYWEIYNNDWSYGGVGDNRSIVVESGTGMVFNNTMDGNSQPQIAIQNVTGGGVPRYNDCDGNSIADGNDPSYDSTAPGYPCRDQIGRATDDSEWSVEGSPPDQSTLEPAYFWGNDLDEYVRWGYTAPTLDDYVVRNRDFYGEKIGGVQTGTYTDMQNVESPSNGDGFWVTNRGDDWCDDSSPNCPNGDSQDGALYVYTSGAWAEYYVPYDYPHPLIGGDSTAPTVTETIIGTDESTVAVYFDESVDAQYCDNGDFYLTCDISGSVNLNNADGNGTSIVFTSASPLDADDVCTLSYIGEGADVRDLADNPLAQFSNDDNVTNTIGADSTPPTVESVVVESDGRTVTFTFSELVDTEDLDNGDFELDCTSHLGNPMLYVSGAGDTRTFTAGYVILPTDSCVANSVPALYSEGEVHDLSEHPLAQFSDQEVTNNAGVDIVADPNRGISMSGGSFQ
jgi:hypothetical protein